MGVIAGGCAATGTTLAEHRSLCSLQVARKTYTLDSYRLPMAARAAGFTGFQHHDALADAEACAAIVVHAAGQHGAQDVEQLGNATRVHLTPLKPRTEKPRPTTLAERRAAARPMAFSD
jgi:DNA polymerase III subunit epsilon